MVKTSSVCVLLLFYWKLIAVEICFLIIYTLTLRHLNIEIFLITYH